MLSGAEVKNSFGRGKGWERGWYVQQELPHISDQYGIWSRIYHWSTCSGFWIFPQSDCVELLTLTRTATDLYRSV